MKSAFTHQTPPTPPHPSHNDVCNHISSYWTLWAWWRQMFGLGMGERCTNRLFHSISGRQEMFINGTAAVTGLESLIVSQTFCQLDQEICRPRRRAAYKHGKKKKKRKNKFWNFETVACTSERLPRETGDHIYPFIGCKARSSAHGPLGVRNRWLLVPVILHFSGPQPPIC